VNLSLQVAQFYVCWCAESITLVEISYPVHVSFGVVTSPQGQEHKSLRQYILHQKNDTDDRCTGTEVIFSLDRIQTSVTYSMEN